MADTLHLDPSFQKALQQLERFCAYQERCSHDVLIKLQGYNLPPPLPEKIIESLTSNHFLDDQRFAHAFTRGKFQKNRWGRIKIRFELTARGIPSNLINEALKSEIPEEDYRKSIHLLILKKKREIKAEKKLNIRDKIINFVTAKGYEPEQIWPIIHELKL